MEAENDNIQEAFDEFDGEFEEDDLRIFRIKFISEVAIGLIFLLVIFTAIK